MVFRNNRQFSEKVIWPVLNFFWGQLQVILYYLGAVSNNRPILVLIMVTYVGAGSPKARNDGWLQKEIRVEVVWNQRWEWVSEMGNKSPAGYSRRLLRLITVVLNFFFKCTDLRRLTTVLKLCVKARFNELPVKLTTLKETLNPKFWILFTNLTTLLKKTLNLKP